MFLLKHLVFYSIILHNIVAMQSIFLIGSFISGDYRRYPRLRRVLNSDDPECASRYSRAEITSSRTNRIRKVDKGEQRTETEYRITGKSRSSSPVVPLWETRARPTFRRLQISAPLRSLVAAVEADKKLTIYSDPFDRAHKRKDAPIVFSREY